MIVEIVEIGDAPVEPGAALFEEHGVATAVNPDGSVAEWKIETRQIWPPLPAETPTASGGAPEVTGGAPVLPETIR